MGQNLDHAGGPTQPASLVTLIAAPFMFATPIHYAFQRDTTPTTAPERYRPEAPSPVNSLHVCGRTRMPICARLALSVVVSIWVLSDSAPVALAGMIGYPAARQERLLQVRLELAGDSFREVMESKGPFVAGREFKIGTGRALMTVVAGLTDWIEIYARFGGGDFKGWDKGTEQKEQGFNGSFGPAYGGGLRLRLLQFGWGAVGVTGQYLRFSSDDDKVDNQEGYRVEGLWEELEAALGVGTRRFETFQLYGGVAYHQSRITFSGGESVLESDFESAIPVRGFAGVNFYPLVDFPAGHFVVNVEARFLGETPQFTLGLQYSF